LGTLCYRFVLVAVLYLSITVLYLSITVSDHHQHLLLFYLAITATTVTAATIIAATVTIATITITSPTIPSHHHIQRVSIPFKSLQVG
jgi:hypothetical protein